MNITEPRVHITLDDDTPQSIPPKTWTRLVFEGEDRFVLIHGEANIDIQLYAEDLALAARPKTWQTMVRRIDGTKEGNVTGREPIPWPQIRNACVRYVNVNLTVYPDVPLTFDVWHDAPQPIVLTKRVPKILVVRAE